MCVLPLQIRLSGNGALEENGCAHLPPAEHPQAGPHGAPRGCYALAKRVSSAKSVKDSKAVCIETWFYITTPSLRSFRYVLVATPIAPLHLPPHVPCRSRRGERAGTCSDACMRVSAAKRDV